MRATRRTVRTAAIATGVIAALAVPASAAFADSPTVPGTGQEQVLPGNEGVPGGDDLSKEPKKDEKKKEETKKEDATGQRKLVNTVKLADNVSTAKVYKVGQNHYEADIFANGAKLDTLVAKGSAAHGQNNGLHVALSPDGKITSYVEGGKKDPVVGGWESKGVKQLGDGWSAKVDVNASARSAKAEIYLNKAVKGSLKAENRTASTKIDGYTFTLTSDGTITKSKKDTPKPDERTFVREYKNIGGSGFDAKVYKVKGGFDADMWAKDPASGKYIKFDTLQQRGNKAAYGQHNGAHFVLNPDGTMKGWTEGKKNDAKKDQKQDQKKVTPKGGVKAGAEGAGAGDDTALLAAGGGMAAAGAAGLGFAMLRRRGDQQG
ncbi:hypothetical protein [Streptomyces indicus]|uniref:Uncharacterized protein n=1 Tax=Streptomyces indicus TaxID=417292 RepID=A0A1G9CLV1_9ACTN|nr:hypothetical protein [Streptomyces indicus]SDK52637.1 hypothetical protein SAMN05421806_108201 [Streptomyces indicus]